MASKEFCERICQRIDKEKVLTSDEKERRKDLIIFLSSYCDERNLVGLFNRLIYARIDTPEKIYDTDISVFEKIRNIGIVKINIIRTIKNLPTIAYQPQKPSQAVSETEDVLVGVCAGLCETLSYESLRVLRNLVCRKMRELEKKGVQNV